METKFEIGDVVRCECKHSAYHGVEGEVTGVRHHPAGVVYDVAGTLSGWNPVNLVLVSRASAQREGGFAVGQRVRVKASALIHEGLVGVVVPWAKAGDGYCAVLFPHQPPNSSGTAFKFDELEPADPATALPPPPDCIACEDRPGGCDHCEPLQPAPMTRAARVLAGMMADPYHSANEEVVGRLISAAEFRAGASVDQIVGELMLAEDAEPDLWAKSRGEDGRSAKERLAAISLDRPLDAERARWERLVLAKVPVGRR